MKATTTTTTASVSATLKTWEPKTWNPSKPYTYSANSVKEEEEAYDEDEYYEDDYDYDESDDEEFKKLSPLGIDPPVSSQQGYAQTLGGYYFNLAKVHMAKF